ncbi:hypothetical protein [Microbacterium lacus]|uniref:Uncharacterized protein n=1 Tax=Microbacterium lacus TaxID=415217 RepID=A0ABN2GJL0_9MICO
MTAITGILVQIITGDMENAGTDGRVYLGLGGREFRLDSRANDFERGSWREYILGRGPKEPDLPSPQIRVEWPGFNDPRIGFVLDTAFLDKSPVYLRFEPVGEDPNWNLKTVFVLVYVGQSSFYGYFTTPAGFDNLWMGHPMGKIVYLTSSWRPERPRPVPDSIRTHLPEVLRTLSD